jgi:hypothetical protein
MYIVQALLIALFIFSLKLCFDAKKAFKNVKEIICLKKKKHLWQNVHIVQIVGNVQKVQTVPIVQSDRSDQVQGSSMLRHGSKDPHRQLA